MRTALHNLHTLALGGGLLVSIHSAALAGESVLPADRDVPFNNVVSRADTRLDHVIAWVPASLAPTAAVAQAMVHVTLNRAARAAESELCNGTWTLSPPVRQKVAPRPVQAPASLGGEVAWFYRVSRGSDTTTGCPGVSRYAFQQEVSRHLPEWLMLQPAYQVSLLQQGNKVLSSKFENGSDNRTLAMHRSRSATTR